MKIRQEVGAVIQQDVTDKAVHTALVVSLVKQTHGITGCQCIRIAIAADPLKVATVNSVARHYGLAGIEGDGRTDGTLVGKYVLYIIVFRIGIYLQVLVQQLRTEVQRSTHTIQLRGLQNTFRMVVFQPQAIGQILDSTRQRQVIICADAGLVDLFLPVCGRLTQQTDLGGIAVCGNSISELISTQHIHKAGNLADGVVGAEVDIEFVGGRTFFSSDDDDTVCGTTTVDGRC